MPCNHKFIQYLNLKKLDFKPSVLIVGTFNPEWPLTNKAEWFYGRTENNNFWDVLPRLQNEPSLITKSPVAWKRFCKNRKISITDLITTIIDANEKSLDDVQLLSGYSDKAIANSFKNFTFTEIVEILKLNPTIEHVYLTRSHKEKFWADLWEPVKIHCKKNNIRCFSLLTPSGYAYFQQGRYNQLNPQKKLSLPDFILKNWKLAWHDQHLL